jgi:2-polyprenyl-3-methyl-5-hydroxy-6-metoxy-1,4-benzoquinol methylase
MMRPCWICENVQGNKSHIAREMMFGFRDEFEYLECISCGCVQIATIPDDLSKYYPDNYYSMKKIRSRSKNPIQRFVLRQRAQHQLGDRNVLGWLIARAGRPRDYFDWLRRGGVRLDSEILDVGCGSGSFLVKLKRHGFTRLSGIDPFLGEDIEYGDGLHIQKKALAEVDGRFDFILLNHSFEHMRDPLSALVEIRRLLNPDGCALLRMPYADSYAWRKYRTHWVQLDAPRHLILHTGKSMRILSEAAGLRLSDITFDSTEFQFLGSEQYLQDIPLIDPRSFLENPGNSLFTSTEIGSFSKKAVELNLQGEGDQACFFLNRP